MSSGRSEPDRLRAPLAPDERHLRRAAESFGLSRQETMASLLLCHSLSAKEIAARMRVKKRTVETYVQRAEEKVGVASRMELVLKIHSTAWRYCIEEILGNAGLD